jgi:hypothetical protein
MWTKLCEIYGKCGKKYGRNKEIQQHETLCNEDEIYC